MNVRGMLAAAVLGGVALSQPVQAWNLIDTGGVLPSAAIAETLDAPGHLVELMARSTPELEYRRYGGEGVARTADYLDAGLVAAGYDVVRVEAPLRRWKIDTTPGFEPLLELVDDTGVALPDQAPIVVESGFGRATNRFEPNLSTSAERDANGAVAPSTAGVVCEVVRLDDVATDPADAAHQCAFVPFADGSPEWNNFLAASTSTVIDAPAEAGVAAIIFQGDPTRDMVFARQVRESVPVVVAAVGDDLVGRRVHVRANGAWVDAVMHNVVGVVPEPRPGAGYVALTAHIDGWFDAAVDNAGGTAAVLDAAEALAARDDLDVGVLVAFVDAEEVGLRGSALVASALRAGLRVGDTTVSMDDLVLNVNLDAPSAKSSDVHGADPDAPVAGALAEDGLPVFSWRALVTSDRFPSDDVDDHSETATVASRFVATFGAHEVFGLPAPSSFWTEFSGGWRTDAQWFHADGIPVVWPVAGYPEYHTNLDRFGGDGYATVDPDDLQAIADAAVHFVVETRGR